MTNCTIFISQSSWYSSFLCCWYPHIFFLLFCQKTLENILVKFWIFWACYNTFWRICLGKFQWGWTKVFLCTCASEWTNVWSKTKFLVLMTGKYISNTIIKSFLVACSILFFLLSTFSVSNIVCILSYRQNAFTQTSCTHSIWELKEE